MARPKGPYPVWFWAVSEMACAVIWPARLVRHSLCQPEDTVIFEHQGRRNPVSLAKQCKENFFSPHRSGWAPDGLHDLCFKGQQVLRPQGHYLRCMQSCGRYHRGDDITPAFQIPLRTMHPVEQTIGLGDAFQYERP